MASKRKENALNPLNPGPGVWLKLRLTNLCEWHSGHNWEHGGKFWVWGVGIGAWGSRFRVQGFRVLDTGNRGSLQGSEFVRLRAKGRACRLLERSLRALPQRLVL